jgi:hypothetical protein
MKHNKIEDRRKVRIREQKQERISESRHKIKNREANERMP